jgi:hypothetical protein
MLKETKSQRLLPMEIITAPIRRMCLLWYWNWDLSTLIKHNILKSLNLERLCLRLREIKSGNIRVLCLCKIGSFCRFTYPTPFVQSAAEAHQKHNDCFNHWTCFDLASNRLQGDTILNYWLHIYVHQVIAIKYFFYYLYFTIMQCPPVPYCRN